MEEKTKLTWFDKLIGKGIEIIFNLFFYACILLFFVIVVIIISYILIWLIDNGLSGIWNFFVTLVKGIWCGANGC